jgi:hypothetical protein
MLVEETNLPTCAWAHLSDIEVRRLAEEVVPPDAPEPFGAYLFHHGDAGADLGRHVERTVFLEAFGNTPAMLAQEYGRYEQTSIFICIIDHLRHMPAGVMRVLVPSPAGFKSLNDIESVWGEPAETFIAATGLALDVARTWDIATLAVAPEYRGKAAQGLVSMALYQSLTLSARKAGVEWFVAILDMPVFRLLRWKLRMIFAGYEGLGPLPYLGSTASIPAWCDVIEAERRLALVDPDLHEILVQGVGIEPAVRRIDLDCVDRLAALGPLVAGL